MSSFGRVALVAACAAVLLIVTDVLLAGRLSPDSRTWYGFFVRSALYAIAAIAAAMAAANLGWSGGRVAWAWTLFSLQFLLLLINYVLRRVTPDASAALTGTLVLANVAQVAAYWLIARVLAALGIGEGLTSITKRIVLTAVALAVAIILCQAPLLAQWQAIQSGDLRIGPLVSVLADVITFILIAPLAASALALRGGSLFWIFGFLTVSILGWMINSGAPSIAEFLVGGADSLRAVRMAGVVIASLFNAAAATTQSLVTVRAMRGAVA